MDDTDRKILRCLKENSRQNATAIGEKINLSTSAVIERIRRLENAHIIQQYTTIIDQQLLGRELTAFVEVRLDHPKYNDNFHEMVKKFDEISECHYVTGDFDFMLKVITGGSRSLEQVLTYIKSISGVALTRTLVVLSTIKNEVSPLP